MIRLYIIMLSLAMGLPACVTPNPRHEKKVSMGSPRIERVSNGVVDMRIPYNVADSYHVQANPAANPYLIPTRLELDPVSSLNIGAIVYPQGHPFILEGSPDTIDVYDGGFEIAVHFLVADRPAAPQKFLLSGNLTYQACDHRMCFPPDSLPLNLDLSY